MEYSVHYNLREGIWEESQVYSMNYKVNNGTGMSSYHCWSQCIAIFSVFIFNSSVPSLQLPPGACMLVLIQLHTTAPCLHKVKLACWLNGWILKHHWYCFIFLKELNFPFGFLLRLYSTVWQKKKKKTASIWD